MPDRRPRVLLLTYPSLYGAGVIQAVASQVGLELVGVGLSWRIFKGKSYPATVRTMVERTGLRFTVYSFFVTDFSWALIRAFREPVALRGSNVRYIRDVNERATIDWMKRCEPDYVASCYFNQLIGDEVIRLPAKACVNMHPAPLPAFRGPDPCFRMMLHGVKDVVYNLQAIDESFDTGGILHEETEPLPDYKSLMHVNLEVWRRGAEVMAQWLAVPREDLQTKPQNNHDAAYYTWPNSREVAQFRANGFRLGSTGDMLHGWNDIARFANNDDT